MEEVKNKNIIYGEFGETYTEKYLLKNKYKIICKNFRTRFGEIDLIAEKNKTIYFIEVRTRSHDYLVHPFETINRKKINKIVKTSRYFISTNKNYNRYNFDFGVASVIFTKSGSSLTVVDFKFVTSPFDFTNNYD